MCLRLDFPGDFVHIPHDLPQPLQIGLVQIRHRCAVLRPAGAGGKDRQHILPGDGITAVVGGDLEAVVGVICFDFLQPVLVFNVELGDGVGQAHAVPGTFRGKEDAEPGANHQRNHTDDHDNQHRDGSACRNGCHNCMSGRPQRFEAHHNHIGHSFDRLLGCFPGCSCSLFGVLHNFGGFGLCSGGSCCARGCGGSHLGRRHRSRRRFLPCSYLESGQRIVPQTALVKIDGIRPPRLVRRHLSGGWCGWFSRGLSLPIPPIIIR